MTSLKILVVASEATPFAKTGGLADVTAALTRTLARADHDVRLLLPFYRKIRESKTTFATHPQLSGLEIELGERSFSCSVRTAPLPDSDVDVWFLDCPELYDRDGLYTNDRDEHMRFALLARATFEVCQRLGWGPDVVHCNDWHTGLVPLYRQAHYDWDELFRGTRTVLTIHNIGYQGVFPAEVAADLGFADDRHLFHNEDLEGGVVSFLKTGILYADALTTVSQTYAREIRTPEFGAGLEELLEARADHLIGIVNGVDYGEWNPATDPHLAEHYSADEPEGKRANTLALLEEFNLTPDPAAPVFGIVSRLTGQKGFDLLPDILPVLLRESSMRLVVLGSGEEKYERYFQWLRDSFPRQVGLYRGYSEPLAHRIEAGADVFLMPSRYEPCGLNQMYSLRYGTLPIVRRTGGLADTVEDFDPVTGEGTGFVFDDFTSDALLHAIRRALHLWREPHAWRRALLTGMRRDFSWEHQIGVYVDLYRHLTGR